jgi:rhodanese-related sulfurtransferase
VLTAFRAVLSGGPDAVTAIPPGQLTPEVFLAPDLFVIDLRRKARPEYTPRPLANSRGFLVFSIGKRLAEIPRNKHILLTCETGYDSPLVAYYLRLKGYSRVSFVVAGLLGWKLAHPDLYARFTRQVAQTARGDDDA